ncbi:GNAT family N-acetyltransferase [Piscinibacter sp. XHJ-5]|uniref:GNAT family N-acetyltransferase n=1 Tax=Piscinibacter sp. XHJ-5 TaxID=3037797 RepID=UPI00245295A5|nr:GNAT family N-acetyltransferase [Piscinibacter sp. XHJ-5]
MNPAFRIALEAADQPDVIALIDELDAYQKPLYPAESHHGIDIGALSRPNVLFAVARDAQGAAVGCGAIVLEAGYGEVKRMFVRPSLRGAGLAKALLGALEAEAARRGCTRLMLETGIRQPEALALYERLGFTRRGPFGDYAEDPLSVFMEKKRQVGGE